MSAIIQVAALIRPSHETATIRAADQRKRPHPRVLKQFKTIPPVTNPDDLI